MIRSVPHTFLKSAVHVILERPWAFDWTVQGFGMLRTYFGGGDGTRYRLNVWDSRYRTENVSLIHDHPWDFESIVIAGRMHNHRFRASQDGVEYVKQSLKTGPGCTFRGEPEIVRLERQPRETYVEGAAYKQAAEEVHISDPEDGTVTLNERHRRPDGEHAYVFWLKGQSWVSAEPRHASIAEVKDITGQALARWFQ